jgi:hypothetical protein
VQKCYDDTCDGCESEGVEIMSKEQLEADMAARKYTLSLVESVYVLLKRGQVTVEQAQLLNWTG